MYSDSLLFCTIMVELIQCIGINAVDLQSVYNGCCGLFHRLTIVLELLYVICVSLVLLFKFSVWALSQLHST